MKIPRTATGFFDARDEVGEIPIKEVVAIAHGVARLLGARVGQIGEPEGSFRQALIEERGSCIVMLFHKVLPLVALARPLEGVDTGHSFIDDDRVAKALHAACHYRLLLKEELDTPISSTDLEYLGSVELRQVNYWQPETVGDLVFNSWD